MNGFNNPFLNPYGFGQQQYMQQVPGTGFQAAPAPVQVIRVNGENGARAFQIGPNSSALLLDESGTMVWLVTSDGAGYRTVSAYDIAPHKDAPELVSGTTRLTLCGMTFSDTHFRISDLEIRRGGKSYTVETMRTLHKLYPRDELYLIIGSDMLLSFDSWYCADEILSLCTLLVLSRENELAPETLREYAVRTLGLTEGVGFMILETTPIVLSSTEIRRAIAAGEDVSASLSDEAYEYIKDKGLYLDD